MRSILPHILVFSGLGVTLLGGVLWFVQHRQEQALAAQTTQPPPQAANNAAARPKIPLTVFADEGVPHEAPQF